MLILSRKQNESVIIQDNIVITVLAIEGDRVKLGITAPREVPVLRQELWVAIQGRNKENGTITVDSLPAILVSQTEKTSK